MQSVAHLVAERRDVRAVAVHALERAHAHLQHDGHPQLRPRRVLHAGRLLRVPDQRARSDSGPGSLVAPITVGVFGALVERYGIRKAHHYGHIAELLFTFGLTFLIEEVVKLIWGKATVDYRVPASLDGPLFTLFNTSFPIYKGFMMLVSVGMLAALYAVLTYTRVGLIVRAALSRPDMVEALGHNVPRVFTWTFGGGAALAGLAGRHRRERVRDGAGDGGRGGPDRLRDRRRRRARVGRRRLRGVDPHRRPPDADGLDRLLGPRRGALDRHPAAARNAR